MKILHKITIILVAIMTAMISGCKAGKADINKAPCVNVARDYVGMMLNEYIGDIKFKNMEDKINFLIQREKDFSNLVVKSITMTGRRECKLGKVTEWSYKDDGRRHSLRAKIVNIEDCPPKDRLSGSHIIKLKTNYGTFTYDTSNESTFKGYCGGFMPIK